MMMDGRALESFLDAMHGLVAEALVVELKMHMKRLEATKNSDEPYMIPPQFLDKVLKFLSQNGINAPQSAPRVDKLAMTLKDLDVDEMMAPRQ